MIKILGSQSQTDRFKAMKELKDFKCRVLISTDLVSIHYSHRCDRILVLDMLGKFKVNATFLLKKIYQPCSWV